MKLLVIILATFSELCAFRYHPCYTGGCPPGNINELQKRHPYIEIFTAPKDAYCTPGVGSDANVKVAFQSSDGVKTLFFLLDQVNKDDFEPDGKDSYLLTSILNLKDVKCVIFKTEDDDGWLMDRAIVTYKNKKIGFYNYNHVVLDTDSDDGKREITHCVQGYTSYTLTLYTSSNLYSSSDKLFLTMEIEGEDGRVGRTSLLYNHGKNSFNRGKSDTFYLYGLPDLNVKCIVLKANKCGDDLWIFDKAILRKGEDEKVFEAKSTGLTSDAKEGIQTLKICVSTAKC